VTIADVLVIAAVSAVAGAAVAALIVRRRARPEGSVGPAGRPAASQGLTVSQVLDLIVTTAPMGIAVVDEFRDVLLTNRRAQELGLVREQLLDDRAWAAVEQVMQLGADLEIDIAVRSDDVGRAPVAVRARVQLLSVVPPKLAVVFADDESEHVRMEAARRDFVANVSHELKTPVGAMGLLAEALLESADDPETVRHFGERLQNESLRLGTMVSELIALSRLQGAEKLPDLSVVDVDSVVKSALERSAVAADAAKITVTADFPSGFEVLGDEALLVTALTNLITNAIAYSPSGSPVSVSRRSRNGNVEISVTDRGIGIPKEYHERVFERFFRVDKARSRATGGTGLGLAIVKHVAANHNGTVRLWSRPGTGSTFTLVLPAHVEPSAENSAEGPKREEIRS
jgi:two-component system sensor histidine kinase SenX3